MPDFRVTGIRRVTVDQSGEAWVDAESEADARAIAEGDPDALDWSWDAIEEDDGDIDSIVINTVEGEKAEAEEETAED